MRLSLALLLLLASTPVTRQVYLMGTHAVLTSYAADQAAGQAQLEEHIRILEDTEDELSVWRPDTPLSRLNATPVGTGFQAERRLFELFQEVAFWVKETEGAFDPGVGRLLQSRGFYGQTAGPAHSTITGFRHLTLDTETHRFVRDADIWIDSGAFGKGEALDRARRQAERNGEDPWMINLGGQIMVWRGVCPLERRRGPSRLLIPTAATKPCSRWN
jgi:thiamine biosynthesis lipoprotein